MAVRRPPAGPAEPGLDIGAGDSFDYALNDDVLHLAMMDAMGHGLSAAVMATLAIGAYRHAPRFDAGLDELYAAMDSAVVDQFTVDHFATAQMARLDVNSGQLQWVNAGHPAPLLLRGHRVLARLDGPTTMPVGFGGARPLVTERMLERGNRVLFFSDGLIKEHREGGEQFGEARLIDLIERGSRDDGSVQETVRRLSRDLMRERRGVTTDDATLLLLEWRGGGSDQVVVMEDHS